FGIAKLPAPGVLQGAARPDSEVATSSGLVGTINYMSPEQARGQGLDSRTDIFSLGVVLYEAATGQRPFGGDTASATLDSILYREPEPAIRRNQQIGAELDRIIGKMLEKDRNLRYQTAAHLSADLQPLRQDSGALVAGGWLGRRRAWVLAA